MHKEALLGPGASPEKATIYRVVDESIDQQEKQIKVQHNGRAIRHREGG
jgi:hypothetical protein